MTVTELMAALSTVEQDHQLVLEKVQGLKAIVNCLLGREDAQARPFLERLKELDAYFVTQFESHMQEEETTLFPLLQKQGGEGPSLVARLRQEHDDIRRMLDEFGNCLKVAAELEDYLPRAVLRDLLTYGWQLWEILDNHAHDETMALRQCAMGCLSSNGQDKL